jgi:hypothetical protein
MSEYQLGDVPVLEGKISLPRQGAWHAELVLDGDTAPDGSVTLQIVSGDNTVTLSGFAYRTGVYQGRASVRVVGGAGKLAAVVDAKYYSNATVQTVLSDVMNDSGESLSSDVPQSLLSQSLALWTRREGPTRSALDALARSLGVGWRVLTDGKVWLGADSFPDAPMFDYELMRTIPSEGRSEIAPDAYPAGLLPGTTFLDQHVSFVEHAIARRTTRTGVWFEDARRNDAASYLRALVEQITWPSLWLPLFPGKVNQQDDDGTLQITPDDPTLPALTKVPIRTFLPGATIKVDSDCRVLVAFEGGDPARPVAMLFEGDASKLKELIVQTADGAKVTLKQGGSVDVTPGSGQDLTFNGGDAEVGRVGDQVEITIPAGTYVVSVTGQAAGVLNPSDQKFQGTIKAGADQVKG